MLYDIGASSFLTNDVLECGKNRKWLGKMWKRKKFCDEARSQNFLLIKNVSYDSFHNLSSQ